jgi:hypothetical protein
LILFTQMGGFPMSKFKPGQSGNLRGRPKGSLNKVTLASQALLDGQAEALTRKAVELALAGNSMALRLCLERVLPPRKDLPVNLNLPPLQGVDDLPQAFQAIIAAVAQGEISPGEGQILNTMLQGFRKGCETMDLEARVAALEKKVAHVKKY